MPPAAAKTFFPDVAAETAAEQEKKEKKEFRAHLRPFNGRQPPRACCWLSSRLDWLHLFTSLHFRVQRRKVELLGSDAYWVGSHSFGG
jgi:hypothetical protein